MVNILKEQQEKDKELLNEIETLKKQLTEKDKETKQLRNEEDDNDKFFRQLRTVNHRTSASDELDEVVRYLALDSIGLNDDPLKWWQNHKNSLPVLAQLGGNIFQFLQLQSLLRDYSQMLGTI
ncbi:6623_t:CDS:2 [Paraglomus brasilianum]|uniref:6623_t:CDS:1 n=1 Tax=Paraglomus brasilianum TaxID=144538 RepID=A0A9N9BZS8_9GLOM|nr:6623_t:CDS:2 [Paraglomus brasilianum]